MILSIIIVNYKTAALCMQAIASVYAEQSDITYEIFVVDNDSGDDVEKSMKGSYPEVRFIQMGYNAGFARANNAAIRMATGDAVLLLNSDTIVMENAVDICFHRLMNGQYIGAAAQLLNADKTPQITGNYVMKGGLNYLLPLPYMGSALKTIAEKFNVKKTNIANVQHEAEVDWINGAFLMVKKDTIAKAGLLDESFFLYAEEAEWCSRLRKYGKFCVYGDVHVVHLQGESAAGAFDSKAKGYQNLFDKKGAQIIVSNMLRIRKEFGLFWFLMMCGLYLVEIPVFLIGNIFSSQYSSEDFRGYCRNIGRFISWFPSIATNKPGFYKLL